MHRTHALRSARAVNGEVRRALALAFAPSATRLPPDSLIPENDGERDIANDRVDIRSTRYGSANSAVARVQP